MTRPRKQRSSSRILVTRRARAGGVPKPQVVRAVRLAAGVRRIDGISVVLADDATLSRLHGQFMGDPAPTDVLTFDLREDPAELASAIDGEVIVSVETAAREARRRRIPLLQEVLRYVIHGTLHLVGYDDRTAAQRRRMRVAENRILRELTAKANRG
jgi:probable rRNA maturation factor